MYWTWFCSQKDYIHMKSKYKKKHNFQWYLQQDEKINLLSEQHWYFLFPVPTNIYIFACLCRHLKEGNSCWGPRMCFVQRADKEGCIAVLAQHVYSGCIQFFPTITSGMSSMLCTIELSFSNHVCAWVYYWYTET